LLKKRQSKATKTKRYSQRYKIAWYFAPTPL
jgi:hypothetical protein